MTLQGYYNRFNASDKYDSLLFRASRGLQSAELNEIQSVLSDRIQKIANVLFKDGSIVRGGSVNIDVQTGFTQLEASSIYALGAIREIAASSFTIPIVGTVQIGIRIVETEITELEAAALRDPATGTRNYNEPGAGRLQRVATWAWGGDGLAGTFFSVYEVQDGNLVTQSTPPEIEGVIQAIARYDREANGNYIARGLQATSIAGGSGQSVVAITAGVGNLQGFKIEKPTDVRFAYLDDPDLKFIANEVKTATGNNPEVVTLNYNPLNTITDVVVTAEKTVTLTHGAFTGASDPLPDNAIVSIQSVSQGATTYSAGSDYLLSGDLVSWSPAGAEPAPGSTYSVTYRYLTSVTPTNINPAAGSFEITGSTLPVAGTLILTDYSWKMPRYDGICLQSDGNFTRVKGLSHPFYPSAPVIPDSLLLIATAYNDWKAKPTVSNNGVRTTTMAETERMKVQIAKLFNLVTQERLKTDISAKDPSAKLGTFVDPFIDEDLRDAGVQQTAVTFGGLLQMPVNYAVSYPPNNNSSVRMLPYTEEAVLEQPLRTTSHLINPYQAFDPLPAIVTLDPSSDTFTEVDLIEESNSRLIRERSGQFGTASQYTGFVGQTVSEGYWDYIWRIRQAEGDGTGSHRVTLTSETQILSETRELVQNVRVRSISYTVEGFFPNENLSELKFDGITINATGTSNASGVLTGSFTIPAGIPAGEKLVEFIGAGGSYGSAVYFAQAGELIRRRVARVQVLTFTTDPVAQTFVLDTSRWITSVDLSFAAKGSDSNDVIVQIVTVSNGVPDGGVLAQGRIPATSMILTGGYTNIPLEAPVFLSEGVEYAIVVLTDDAQHAVRVAELGQFDSTNQAFVTAQAYTVGVFLSSSNGRTWTPDQAKDLTFRLNGALFTSTSQTVSLGNVSGSSVSSLASLLPVEISGVSSRAYLEVALPSGDIVQLAPGQFSELDSALTGTFSVSLKMEGDSYNSPLVYPDAQIGLGTLQANGTYFSRKFEAGAGTVKVYFEGYVSGTATVTPEFWDSASSTYKSMNLVSATPVGDGWAEYVYDGTLVGTTTGAKLTLAGSPAYRPQLRNLRVVVL